MIKLWVTENKQPAQDPWVSWLAAKIWSNVLHQSYQCSLGTIFCLLLYSFAGMAQRSSGFSSSTHLGTCVGSCILEEQKEAHCVFAECWRSSLTVCLQNSVLFLHCVFAEFSVVLGAEKQGWLVSHMCYLAFRCVSCNQHVSCFPFWVWSLIMKSFFLVLNKINL